MGMAYPAAKVVIDMKDTSNPDMTIKITGYQWKWSYDYLNDGIRYYSTLATPREQIDGTAAKGEHYLLEVDEPMVVPVGKRVRVLITANDVIHSWWVPALGVKQDGIPGFIRDSWFKADTIGTYRGQCAELCGKEHGFMPIVVEVVSEDDYKAWVAKKQGTAHAAAADNDKTFEVAELVARGEKVYQANCAVCHQPTEWGFRVHSCRSTFQSRHRADCGPHPGGNERPAGHCDGGIRQPVVGCGHRRCRDLPAQCMGQQMGDAAQPAAIAAVRAGPPKPPPRPRSEQSRGEPSHA